MRTSRWSQQNFRSFFVSACWPHRPGQEEAAAQAEEQVGPGV